MNDLKIKIYFLVQLFKKLKSLTFLNIIYKFNSKIF